MRDTTSLTRQFDEAESQEPLLVPDKVENAFIIPNRNWNGLVDDYNISHKKKFFLTSLQCKSIIENVKRGYPAQSMFKSLGYSRPRYHTLVNNAGELEERFEILYNKEDLTEEETEEFHGLMRHPLRILIMDVLRAEGVSELLVWEKFTKNAEGNSDLQFQLTKAKFKEMFSERTPESTGINVQIRLGGDDDWVKDV